MIDQPWYLFNREKTINRMSKLDENYVREWESYKSLKWADIFDPNAPFASFGPFIQQNNSKLYNLNAKLCPLWGNNPPFTQFLNNNELSLSKYAQSFGYKYLSVLSSQELKKLNAHKLTRQQIYEDTLDCIVLDESEVLGHRETSFLLKEQKFEILITTSNPNFFLVFHNKSDLESNKILAKENAGEINFFFESNLLKEPSRINLIESLLKPLNSNGRFIVINASVDELYKYSIVAEELEKGKSVISLPLCLSEKEIVDIVNRIKGF
jgi:hypothetical protein